jgi:hypothetical protein
LAPSRQSGLLRLAVLASITMMGMPLISSTMSGRRVERPSIENWLVTHQSLASRFS